MDLLRGSRWKVRLRGCQLELVVFDDFLLFRKINLQFCVYTVANGLCNFDLNANEINTRWNDLLSNQQQIEDDTTIPQRNWDVGFIAPNFLIIVVLSSCLKSIIRRRFILLFN